MGESEFFSASWLSPVLPAAAYRCLFSPIALATIVFRPSVLSLPITVHCCLFYGPRDSGKNDVQCSCTVYTFCVPETEPSNVFSQ